MGVGGTNCPFRPEACGQSGGESNLSPSPARFPHPPLPHHVIPPRRPNPAEPSSPLSRRPSVQTWPPKPPQRRSSLTREGGEGGGGGERAPSAQEAQPGGGRARKGCGRSGLRSARPLQSRESPAPRSRQAVTGKPSPLPFLTRTHTDRDTLTRPPGLYLSPSPSGECNFAE